MRSSAWVIAVFTILASLHCASAAEDCPGKPFRLSYAERTGADRTIEAIEYAEVSDNLAPESTDFFDLVEQKVLEFKKKAGRDLNANEIRQLLVSRYCATHSATTYLAFYGIVSAVLRLEDSAPQ